MVLDDFELKLRGKAYRPLVVGGMGVDISTAGLALAAARSGAIGHISDAMSPYVSDKRFRTHFQNEKREHFRDHDWDAPKEPVAWDIKSVYQAQLNHVGATMNAKRGTGAVFINVMEKLAMGAPRETLRARLQGALDAGIDGITLSAGLHTGTLALMDDNARFRDANIGIIVSSARALKIFLRSAERVNRMPDYIIVEGPLAGGHLGFGPDWRDYSLRVIVQEVMDLLRELDLTIPVLPAGGIFSGGDAVSYLQMGASGVQVATRFTISQECGFPDDVKQIYIRSEEDDVEVNMTSPTGYPMRMLKSSPSLRSNVKPNCEALGYIIDAKGYCAYREAYDKVGFDAVGRKLPVTEKMCICYHFMRYDCYTCGQNVFRLKETTSVLPDGNFYLPPAEWITEDYLGSQEIQVAVPPSDTECPIAASA